MHLKPLSIYHGKTRKYTQLWKIYRLLKNLHQSKIEAFLKNYWNQQGKCEVSVIQNRDSIDGSEDSETNNTINQVQQIPHFVTVQILAQDFEERHEHKTAGSQGRQKCNDNLVFDLDVGTEDAHTSDDTTRSGYRKQHLKGGRYWMSTKVKDDFLLESQLKIFNQYA